MSENFSFNAIKMRMAVEAIAALFTPIIESAVKKAVEEVIDMEEREHDCRTYSRQEAAGLLSITLPTLDKLAANGKLTPIKIGRRVVFSARDVDAIVGKPIKYMRGGR